MFSLMMIGVNKQSKAMVATANEKRKGAMKMQGFHGKFR